MRVRVRMRSVIAYSDTVSEPASPLTLERVRSFHTDFALRLERLALIPQVGRLVCAFLRCLACRFRQRPDPRGVLVVLEGDGVGSVLDKVEVLEDGAGRAGRFRDGRGWAASKLEINRWYSQEPASCLLDVPAAALGCALAAARGDGDEAKARTVENGVTVRLVG